MPIRFDYNDFSWQLKPAGYYSDCLYACLEEGIKGGYLQDVAELVLARAQQYLVDILAFGPPETEAHAFIDAIRTLGQVRGIFLRERVSPK